MIYSFQITANWYYIIISLFILGLGYGLYQSPNNKMLISVTPDTFKTQVSSMMTLTKNLGSVLGNAFAALILSTSLTQTALSGKLVLTGSQSTNFMIGFERIFLFAAVLSVLLMISTFDLEKYVKKINFPIFIKRLKLSNKPKMPRKQVQSK